MDEVLLQCHKENIVDVISVTPQEYREMGKDVEIVYGYGYSPFGECLLSFTVQGICYLAFIDGDREAAFERFRGAWANASLLRSDEKVGEYLTGIFTQNKRFPLLLKGTNFQINVWKALLDIESGTLRSYKSVAKALHRPKAVRAVANAIAANNIAYLIPCHRVVASSGAMSGYRWGVERKKTLIAYENRNKGVLF